MTGDRDTSGDWTTSRAGTTAVATCETAVDAFGAMCGSPILVAWEHLPKVRDGYLTRCPVHGGDEYLSDAPSAQQVAESVVRERAAAEERWLGHLNKKAA